MGDFKKHKALWNDVVHGTPTESLAAASKLNQLGEMSEKTFQMRIKGKKRYRDSAKEPRK